MGQGMPPGAEWPLAMRGPIERVKKGKLPIPTPQEIIKDKLKELILRHGWDALKWGWDELTAKPDLIEQLKKKHEQKQLGKGSGGGALVALAVVALATKRKRRSRR